MSVWMAGLGSTRLEYWIITGCARGNMVTSEMQSPTTVASRAHLAHAR